VLLLGPVGAARAISVEKILGGGRLAAYATVRTRADGGASVRGIRLDAVSLRAVGFRAVTTYETSRATVPVCRFFKRVGFATVLVGIADPTDAGEVRRAIRLRRCADGYVVGTLGISEKRYDRDALAAVIARVRARSGRPVTTRETIEVLRADASLVRLGDWVFPTIHPFAAGKRESQDACGWTIFAYRDLADGAPAGVPTVVAETGLPTEGALATSEHYQRAFFMCLESRQVPFGYFEAFDRPGADPVAGHFGVFRADDTPKLWAAQQIRPTLAIERMADGLRGHVDGVSPRLVRIVVYAKGARWDAMPAVQPNPRGAWSVAVPRDRAAAVFVVTPAWVAPSPVERLPAVDRMQVFATRELPPM
jgi:hypothetical protein